MALPFEALLVGTSDGSRRYIEPEVDERQCTVEGVAHMMRRFANRFKREPLPIDPAGVKPEPPRADNIPTVG